MTLNNDAATDGDTSNAPALSDYESARARNIERNNARLRSLGLISLLEQKKSNDLAWGRYTEETPPDNSSEEESTSDEEYSERLHPRKKRKKKAISTKTPREGSRKSRRLMKLPSENTSETITDEDPTEKRERI